MEEEGTAVVRKQLALESTGDKIRAVHMHGLYIASWSIYHANEVDIHKIVVDEWHDSDRSEVSNLFNGEPVEQYFPASDGSWCLKRLNNIHVV